MGLPDRNSAKTWGGKLLVDRDGTEIGTCTQVFVDDATGLPEWAEADLSGGPAVLPLIDAAEAGDSVRVAVRQVDVAGAPRVDDPGHISEDEEERLYRHYGIQFSREHSESLLPVDQPVVPDAGEPATPVPSTATFPSTSGTDVSDLTDLGDVGDAVEKNRRGLLPALTAGLVGAVAAAAAAVFWWRQRHQLPPTRKELLVARARAVALTVANRKEQAATSAAPWLQSGRERSSAAAQQAAVQARLRAEQAAVHARVAARQAVALAATARTLRLQRIPTDADLPPAPTAGGQRKAKVMSLLQTAGGFTAGYVVRARTSGARTEQADQAGQATAGQRRQFQEIAGRVQGRVTDTLQAGNAQLSQRAGAVAGKVRRRSDSGDEGPSSSGDLGKHV